MRYSRSAITQLTKWYKSVLIKCALLNAAFFVSMGAVNANAAAPTITNGDDAAYTWKESDANTDIKVNVDGTDYYVDIKKTTYNTDKTLTYAWDEEEHELTVTASDLTTSKPTADTDGNYIGNFINNSVGTANGGALNNSGTIDTLQGDFIANRTITGHYTYYVGYGGAIYNTGTINNITGDFISNGASGDSSAARYSNMGGAIHNAADAVIGNINGSFIGNYARSSYGGGIYNKGSITKITADFIGNWASGGSAIYNAVGGSISDISGDYIGNFSTALHNQGTIGKIKGNFLKNRGVAIYNESGDINEISGYFADISGQYGAIHFEIDSNNQRNATIGSITGEFIGNTAEDYSGGAIFVESYSGDYEANIGKITGTFKNNTAGINGYGDGNGGAIYIYNYSNADTIEEISGTLENNSAKYRGGAIYFAGKTDLISGTFKNNSVIFTANIDNARGGALYTGGTITSLTGTFENNTSTGFGGALYATGNIVNSTADFSGNGAVYGGAISNFGQITLSGSLFENNSASQYGGAIYTGGNATITNATFTGNSATYRGGAILSYNQTTEILDSSFTNNKAPEGAAIFVNGGTVNITAKNKDVEFSNNNTTGLADGTGSGIKTVAGSTLNLEAQNGNKITINDSVDLKGTTNINGGEIVLGQKAANSITDAANLRISGGTLNIANNNIDTLSFANTINNLNDFNLIIDVDADAETVIADKITANLNSSSSVYLTALNFINSTAQSGEVQIADSGIKSLLALSDDIDTGIYATVNYDNTTGMLSFSDPISWLIPTLGAQSAYKWTKENTGLIPMIYKPDTDDEKTFYIDIKKKIYTDTNDNERTLTYSWNTDTHKLTVTKSGAAVKTDGIEYVGNSDDWGGALMNPGNVSGWFVGNSAGTGGALFVQDNSPDTINAHFIGNQATGYGDGYGGAIYTDNTIGSIVGDFIGNSGWFGGAIYSYQAAINSVKGDFIGNSVSATNGHPNGGAIFLQNNASITTIEGNFVGNTAIANNEGYYALGGAISNRGGSNISTINADFIGNLASAPRNYANGGAIYNDGGSNIGLINGKFSDNSADMGGAIYNGVSSTITKITGKFVGNSVSAGSNDYSVGGAIVNANNAYIGEIEADFINNSAKDSSCDQGGAIFVGLYSTIDSIIGNFEGNTAKDSGEYGYGGAIYTLSSTINTLTGNFENNSADWGGAIYNEQYVETEIKTLIGNLTGNFTNNSALYGGAINNNGVITQLTGNFENNSAMRGGAIFNRGTFSSITGDFIGNSSTLEELSGGAIYNTGSGTINLYDSSFKNNIGTEGAAIFVNSGTVSVTAKTKDIEFTNNNSTGTTEGTGTGIQTAAGATLDLEALGTNKITINDAMTLNGNTNIKGGKIVLGQKAGTSSLGALSFTNTPTLDLANDVAQTINATSVKGNATLNFDIDFSGADVASDAINITNGGQTGTITLDDVNTIGTIREFSNLEILKGVTDGVTLVLSEALQADERFNGEEHETITGTISDYKDDVTFGEFTNDEFTSTTYAHKVANSLSVVDGTKLSYEEVETQAEYQKSQTKQDVLQALNQSTSATRSLTATDAGATYNVGADLGTTGGGKLTIQGTTDGTNTSTVDLKGQNGFTVGSGATLTLDTIKIIGAKAEDGALIDNTAGTVELNNVEVAASNNNVITNASAMNLSGTNNINAGVNGTGTANIISGTTTVNKQLNQSAVNIAAGAELSADADNIAAKVANSGKYTVTGGTIAKDVTGGTLNINGDVTVGNTANIATTSTNISPTASLNVGTQSVNLGNATVNGTLKLAITDIAADSSSYTGGKINAENLNLGKNSKLLLTVAPNLIAKKASTGALDIIDVNGSTTGNFAEMMSNNRYKLTVDNNGKFVITNYASVADIIEGAGGSQNNVATGIAWDETTFVGEKKATQVQNVLNELSQHNEQAYIKALSDLAPTDSAVVTGITQDFNNLIGNRVASRLANQGLNSGDEIMTPAHAWIQTLYNHSKQDSSKHMNGFSGNTTGVAFGFDSKFSERILLGLGYAYGYTDIDTGGKDIDVKGHSLYIYGKYQPNQWYIRGTLLYGYADYKEKANVAGIANKGKYDVQNIGIQAYSGYDFVNGVTPEIGMRATHINRNNYTDKIGQHIKSDDIDILTIVAGIRYAPELQSAEYTLRPEAHIAATYDVVRDDTNADVVVGTSQYSVKGQNLRRLGVEASIGAEVSFGNWDLAAEYDLGMRKDYISHTGMLKAKYNF